MGDYRQEVKTYIFMKHARYFYVILEDIDREKLTFLRIDLLPVMKHQIPINILITLITTTWRSCSSLDNGLALTPPMGFETPFEKEFQNEKYVKQMADEVVNQQYKDLGYEYIIISSVPVFGSEGDGGILEVNDKDYPSGIKNLADYVHSKGLKLGLKMNGIYLYEFGRRIYTQIDMKKHAKTLAEWGIDYLRLDDTRITMYNTSHTIQEYLPLGKFLNETGRPIVYDCEWVYRFENPTAPIDYETIADHCNLWSIHILASWLPKNDLTRHAGPGRWAYIPRRVYIDAFNYNPQKWMMAQDAIFGLPLTPDFDLRNLTTQSKAILQNKRIIEIHQDPLRTPGHSVLKDGLIEIAARPVAPEVEGKRSFAIGFFSYDYKTEPIAYNISLNKLQLDNPNGYKFTDLFSSPADESTSFISFPDSRIHVIISQGKSTPFIVILHNHSEHFKRYFSNASKLRSISESDSTSIKWSRLEETCVAVTAAQVSFNSLSLDEIGKTFNKWQDRMASCLSVNGAYFEKDIRSSDLYDSE